MKATLCTILGIVGAAIAALLGGWDMALKTLCIFMAIDYVSGLIVAGVFKASTKSESGALESRAGLKGLLRKMAMLLDNRKFRTHGSPDPGRDHERDRRSQRRKKYKVTRGLRASFFIWRKA